MAAESNSCLSGSEVSNRARINLDGLEGFFEEDQQFFEDDQQELLAKGLSIKQAVFYYGATRRSIKTRIRKGTIPAIRMPESAGGKWRIFPEGVPSQLQDLIPEEHTKQSKPAGGKNATTDNKESFDATPENTDRETGDPQLFQDFSVPGIDSPGQLILKTAGFLVEEKGPAATEKQEDEVFDFSPDRPMRPNMSSTADEDTVCPQVEAEQIQTQPPTAFDLFFALPVASAQSAEPQCVRDAIQITDSEQAVCLPARQELEHPGAVGVASLIRQDTPETLTLLAMLQSIESPDPSVQMLEKMTQMEKLLEDANYRNSYLEARLTGMEDQLKFLTQEHCRKHSSNDVILVLPALVLLAAMLLFRFMGMTAL
jgi:hypothetical protein